MTEEQKAKRKASADKRAKAAKRQRGLWRDLANTERARVRKWRKAQAKDGKALPKCWHVRCNDPEAPGRAGVCLTAAAK